MLCRAVPIGGRQRAARGGGGRNECPGVGGEPCAGRGKKGLAEWRRLMQNYTPWRWPQGRFRYPPAGPGPRFHAGNPGVAKPGTAARPAAGAHPTGDEMGRVAQRESTTLTS